jgi:hypothetical protein
MPMKDKDFYTNRCDGLDRQTARLTPWSMTFTLICQPQKGTGEPTHVSRFANSVPHLPPIAFGLFKRRHCICLRLQAAVERKAFPAETPDAE